MATMKSNEVSPLVFATLQGLAGNQLGAFCIARDCAVKSLEGDYLARATALEAKLAQFPKVQAGPLGQEFAAMFQFLKDSLIKLRSGNYSKVYGDDTPHAIEKKAYANYLRMAQIEKQILEEASKVGDTGVQLDPVVVDSIAKAGDKLTPGQGPLPDTQPINWLLWGGVGAGVLALGGTLWWYASKKKPTAVAGVGRIVGWSGGGGRKSRSRRRSR